MSPGVAISPVLQLGAERPSTEQPRTERPGAEFYNIKQPRAELPEDRTSDRQFFTASNPLGAE
jgi:hypothetical protein